MCVKGMMEGVRFSWLVDTGSSMTILSLREYSKIRRSWRPALGPCTRKLYQADGGPMRTEGQVPVRIGVGEFSIRHISVVVDCGDEGILGVDVLTRGGARIDLAARTVSLEGLVVPLHARGS